MASGVVVLDANVLYGIEVTDLFLTMAARRRRHPKTHRDIIEALSSELPQSMAGLSP